MRNPALAVRLIVGALLCLALARPAGAGPSTPGSINMQTFWNAVTKVTEARGASANNHALHWVFLVSTSGATSNSAVSQGMRDFLREFTRTYLRSNGKAGDQISLVPYQLNVREDKVKPRLTVGKLASDGTPEVDEDKISGYLPDKATPEYDTNNKLYTGGHDNEKAIHYALTHVVGDQDKDFILVVLGDVDASATPRDVPDYPLFAQTSPNDYKAALKAHGVADEVIHFNIDYTKDGTGWPIYVRLYTPANMAATEFGTARSQIPGPAKAPATAPNRPTPGTQPVNSNPPVTPAKPEDPNAGGDDSTWALVVVGLLVLGALGTLAYLYIRPIRMEVEKEPLTLARGEEAVIYGPDSKTERKGVLLRKERYPSLPTGELATVTHLGMGKARVTGAGKCQVRNALGDKDEVTLQRGQEESVSLIYNNSTYPVQVNVYKK